MLDVAVISSPAYRGEWTPANNSCQLSQFSVAVISVAKERGRSSDSEEKRLPGSRGISPDFPIKIANPNLKDVITF